MSVVGLSKACVGDRSLAGTADSNPAVGWLSFSCVCFVLSGIGGFIVLNSRPEDSHRG